MKPSAPSMFIAERIEASGGGFKLTSAIQGVGLAALAPGRHSSQSYRVAIAGDIADRRALKSRRHRSGTSGSNPLSRPRCSSSSVRITVLPCP